MQMIVTQKQDNILYLSGVLDYCTLNELWQSKVTLLAGVSRINVAGLTRVDSSGLALLVHFCLKQNIKITAINQQLETLIALYDLDAVLI